MQLHPLETAPPATSLQLPDYFPTSAAHAHPGFSTLAAHQPRPLTYVAPAQIFVGDRQVRPYRVRAYDEAEIAKFQRRNAENNLKYVAQAQALLTMERSQQRAPEVVQQQVGRAPCAPFDYQTSTRQIVEELQMDQFQPRFGHVSGQIGVATVAGNDKISTQEIAFFEPKIQDVMRDEIMQNLYRGTLQKQLDAQMQQNGNFASYQQNNVQQQAFNGWNQQPTGNGNWQQFGQQNQYGAGNQIPAFNYGQNQQNQQGSNAVQYSQLQQRQNQSQQPQIQQNQAPLAPPISNNVANTSIELDVDFSEIALNEDKINKHIEFNKQAARQIEEIDNMVSDAKKINAFSQNNRSKDADLALEHNFSMISSGIDEQNVQKKPKNSTMSQIDDSLSEFNIDKIVAKVPQKRPDSVVRIPKQSSQDVIKGLLNGDETLDSTLDISIEAPKPKLPKKQIKKSPVKVAKKVAKVAKPMKKQIIESSEDDSFLQQIMKKDHHKAAKRAIESSDDLGLGFSDSDF
ncbi:hypothetical protein SS50377_27287 [Spironucleus salmonicida]|uniref:Uncharacterized protein n=1 Tax=Spironucleus salmonicida TaxID=348837 RepID=V6LKP0_9EUKA|nr:hypothetical protein SS50377_27275 [Spironucleus salmonicida]KAH0570993.1 hypothetical protein SS50377_27287 [Spironucleus salmonicida]|eukprot:EST44296.1 Hypothetical protein SS50377_15830 [Spironucleus salmonicida]